MKRRNNITKPIAIAVLAAGGCGAIPDVVIKTARERAIQALDNAVGDAVDGVIDNTVGQLFELDDFELLFDDQNHEERDEEASEEDAAESDERDRETRRGFSESNRLP